MIEAADFVSAARDASFRLWTGVPCSYLTPFIDHVAGSPDLTYLAAANEGDAVAIAAGSQLGGWPAIAMFQNSGLGNAVSPLTSLTFTLRIPVLLIVTWRGEPGGAADEPQHELMGAITPGMLELMRIPWEPFPTDSAAIAPALGRAQEHMRESKTPYALVMRKGSVEAGSAGSAGSPPRMAARLDREEVLRTVRGAAGSDAVLIATTGFMGRTLYALGDKPDQIYMVGSMGCAASLGQGLATARPDRRVIVLDGDGAVLMRLGALATAGWYAPPNLVHVVLDNGAHASTGGQKTATERVDLARVAAACGYRQIRAVETREELANALASGEATAGSVSARSAPEPDVPGGPLFLHVRVSDRELADLPRPVVTPDAVAARFHAHLAEFAAVQAGRR